MAAIFTLPRSVLLNADGNPIPGGKVSFFDAGTTTPRAVYSDAGLTTPISQPVTADSAGLLPLIYMATGAYKIIVADADSVTIYSADNLDSGVPAGSGALAISVGGTGATTASGARTNLGAAAQSDLNALSSAVSSIQGQITDVGGELGDLAGQDKITRDTSARASALQWRRTPSSPRSMVLPAISLPVRIGLRWRGLIYEDVLELHCNHQSP
jgi:hypothetical protein